MQDTKRYQHELASAFQALTLQDLVALGAQTLQPAFRGTSLELGSWLTRAARAEFDGRQGHDAEPPTLFDADSLDDGALADAVQAALALSHSTVTPTADNFARALVTWLSLFAIVRLKARSIAMAN